MTTGEHPMDQLANLHARFAPFHELAFHLCEAHEKGMQHDSVPPLSYALAKALCEFDDDLGLTENRVRTWFERHKP